MNGGGGSSSAGITPDFYAGLFVAAFFPVIDLAGSVAVRCAFAPTAEKERVFLTTAVANFLVLAESRRRKKNHIWSLGRMMPYHGFFQEVQGLGYALLDFEIVIFWVLPFMRWVVEHCDLSPQLDLEQQTFEAR